jgi:hypothetical protein
LRAATADALAALKDASTLPPCPDSATEQAYRAAVQNLTSQVEAVPASGDVAAAQELAATAGAAFRGTEEALAGAYS